MRMYISPLCFALVAITIACGHQESATDLKLIGGQKVDNNPEVKSVFPSTIGYLLGEANSECTGTRISDNVYVSAAHCVVKAKSGDKVTVTASNARPFDLKIENIRIIPGYTEGSSNSSDLATFSLQFRTTEEKFIFDRFVETARVDYSAPVLDQEVTLAGFGCTETADISGLFSNCLKRTDFKYMKTAKSKISATDQGLIFEGDGRYFRLPIPFLFDGKVDGYIGSGDSGGPVYNGRNEIIGVNSSTMGLAIKDLSKGTSYHNWLGFPHNQQFLQQSLAKPASLFLSENGLYRYANGDVYQGDLANGMPHGQGRMRYADGKVYQGGFVNGVRSGQGHQDWNAGAKMISFDGNWAEDRPNGSGSMVFTTGQEYEGNFVGGKMEGQGTMTYPDGDVRSGTFVQSKREGQFVLTKPDGSRHLQLFSGDALVSSTRME